MKNFNASIKALYFGAFFILITFVIGLILRIVSVFTSPSINYKNILHTHSHLGFLGAVYFLIIGLFLKNFVKTDKHKLFNINLSLTLIATVGMLISFPLQGYKAISIAFSTLHILCTLHFFFLFLRNRNSVDGLSNIFLNYALLFNVLSIFGPFALPFIIKIYGHNSPYYFNAIYFYLHNQYNGWFLFSVLSLLFFINKNLNSYNRRQIHALAFSQLLLIFQNFIWTGNNSSFAVLAIAGALMQFVIIFNLVAYNLKILMTKSSLLQLLMIVLLLKAVIQLIGCIPDVMNISYINRHLIIAYLHLYLLGFITPILYFIINKTFNLDVLNKKTGYLYFIGLALMLMTLCLQITGLLSFALFYSVLILSGLMIIFSGGIIVLNFFKTSLKES